MRFVLLMALGVATACRANELQVFREQVLALQYTDAAKTAELVSQLEGLSQAEARDFYLHLGIMRGQLHGRHRPIAKGPDPDSNSHSLWLRNFAVFARQLIDIHREDIDIPPGIWPDGDKEFLGRGQRHVGGSLQGADQFRLFHI